MTLRIYVILIYYLPQFLCAGIWFGGYSFGDISIWIATILDPIKFGIIWGGFWVTMAARYNNNETFFKLLLYTLPFVLFLEIVVDFLSSLFFGKNLLTLLQLDLYAIVTFIVYFLTAIFPYSVSWFVGYSKIFFKNFSITPVKALTIGIFFISYGVIMSLYGVNFVIGLEPIDYEITKDTSSFQFEVYMIARSFLQAIISYILFITLCRSVFSSTTWIVIGFIIYAIAGLIATFKIWSIKEVLSNLYFLFLPIYYTIVAGHVTGNNMAIKDQLNADIINNKNMLIKLKEQLELELKYLDHKLISEISEKDSTENAGFDPRIKEIHVQIKHIKTELYRVKELISAIDSKKQT